MKIAMIGHKDFPSRSGGVEVVVYELSTRLAKKGDEVTVYNRTTKWFGRSSSAEGVKIRFAPTFKKESLNAMVASFTGTIKATFKKYDILHFHAIGPSAMLFFPHFLGRKTIATVHGLDWQRDKWGFLASTYLKFGEKMAAKYADAVIVLSEANKEYFKEKYGRDTVLIKNAITPIRELEANNIKKDYGLKKNDYILYLGRLTPEKGIKDLIEAFKEINTNKKLIIAGDDKPTRYVDEIKELAKEDIRIKFIGAVSGEKLEELYSNALLYVLPSRIEGLALTLLEAMSCGTRCLVSDIPENTSVTLDFGDSFKCSDVDDLRNTLIHILSQDAAYINKDKQIAYIKEKYSYERVIKETEAVYKEVLNRKV